MSGRVRSMMALAAVGCIALAQAHAEAPQAYPTQPIKFIVPYPPGGATDIVVRTYAPFVSEILGQPLILDYRPGGGTNIGAAAAAHSDPDGYTLYAANFASNAVNKWLFKDLPYDPQTDFTDVAMLVRSTLFLCSKPGSPITSLGQLINAAKKNPGKLNYGSTGFGSPNHIAGELLKQLGGIDMQHVPYKGAGPLVTGLLSGDVDFGFDASVIVHHRNGTLKCFGGSADFRWPTDPEIPTIAETLPGYNLTSFFGVVGPAKIPGPIVEKLNEAFRAAAQRPEVAKALEVTAAIPFPATVKETQDFLTDQGKRWAPVVKASGAKVP